ncbi:annexin-like protein RJ4 [Senna tora]|uniref:Annexin n=1 Tax=Senna tora TaxID=362788 RepID=A0A834X258_9FABA|nr:annexin-like protein RJ4 [Senna tora]
MATLVSPTQISPVEDAEALYKAFKGWGTDEKAVIAILGHRNNSQKQQIRKAYQQLFHEDLIKRLESEISGDFERAMYRWILEPWDRDAVLANVAINKNGTNMKTMIDYNVILEIGCVHSPEELLALLVGLVSSYRYGGDEINAKLAQTEADILHGAIKDKKGCYEEVIRILTTRSKTQLIATFNRYRDVHGSSITKKLLDDASDDFHKALHTAIRCINDHKKYYEKVLRNAIKRVGTYEGALTRVIVTRSEKDMKEIKELYYKRNSEHLEDSIAKEVSGDYKKFLLTLLGKQDV